jgi:hypothetical protein
MLSRQRLIGALPIVILCLTGCSALPIGDPAPPDVGLASRGGDLELLVPLCPGERVEEVELTPDEQSGSPDAVWSGAPADGLQGHLVLSTDDFSNPEGSYELSTGLVVEVTTSQILYVSVWKPSYRSTPPGSVWFRDKVTAKSDVRPTCGS